MSLISHFVVYSALSPNQDSCFFLLLSDALVLIFHVMLLACLPPFAVRLSSLARRHAIPIHLIGGLGTRDLSVPAESHPENTRALGLDASSIPGHPSGDDDAGSIYKVAKGKRKLPKRKPKDNILPMATTTATVLDRVIGLLDSSSQSSEQSSKAVPPSVKTSRSRGLKKKKLSSPPSNNDSMAEIADEVVPTPAAAHPPPYSPPPMVKKSRSKRLKKISDLASDNDSLKVEIPDDEVVLTPSPPYLVFGKKTTKFWASGLPSTVTNAIESPEPASPSPVETSPELRTGVALIGLPPFTTVAEVARIALRTRVTPGDVLAVRLWLRSAPSRVPKAEDEEHVAGVDEKGKDDDRPDWTLGARIQFRETGMAQEFQMPPLLLEVSPPQLTDPRACDRAPVANQLRVRVFPSAEFSKHWKPEDLVLLAAETPPWHDAMFSQQCQPFELAPRNAESIDATTDPEPDAEDTGTQDEKIRERARILQSLWGRLETPLQSDVVDAGAHAPPTTPEVPAEDSLSSAHPATADSARETVQTVVHEPEEKTLPGQELMQRAKKQLSPNSVLISVHTGLRVDFPPYSLPTDTRWLALRVPGSGVSVVAPPSSVPTDTYSQPPLTQEEEDEQKDPIVERYATAFRNALARERELEADLRHARAVAQERALAVARTEAEVQVRADFGRYGALEGVWVRGARMHAPTPAGSSDSGADYAEGESTANGKQWVYEMHALVAFAATQDAARAKTLLAVQPGYASAGMRFVSQPWAEALGGPRWEEQSHLTVGGEVRLEEADGARQGWARRLEREHRAEARAREREEERERQRGTAEGTWGKERLDEIRERLRRVQRRIEWEKEREEAWARARVRTAAQTADAGASAMENYSGTISESESDGTSSSDSDSDSSSSSSSSDSDSDSDSDSERDPSESESGGDSESVPYFAQGNLKR
ncbi:hypothetical protein C8R45DRAFT_1093758 [Mycena sanguinolenta]|nr:hypothetical protein C8R45DRAFT_1093758 [Mycena sanguinolenta]